MKKQVKKLTLAKETIYGLTDAETRVAGAAVVVGREISLDCPTTSVWYACWGSLGCSYIC
jgi:hypothetical protein